MELTLEQIDDFIQGKETPPEVVAQIEREIEDKNSLVHQVSAKYAKLSRLAFDPEGPMLGDVK